MTQRMSRAEASNDNREVLDLHIPIGSMLMKSANVNYFDFEWMPCDGRSVPRSQFPALFNVIKTTFGPSDENTFKLPDLPQALGSSYVIRVK